MKIAIHHRQGSFSDRWIEYCKENGINFKIVNASFKSLPLTRSQTGLSLIGDILTYFAIAFASIFNYLLSYFLDFLSAACPL